MRTTTKRKLWGRGHVAQALRAASQLLADAAKAAGKPVEDPLVKEICDVIKELKEAVEAIGIYRVPNKRLQAAILREKAHMDDLLAIAMAIPVTAEEKQPSGGSLKKGGEKCLYYVVSGSRRRRNWSTTKRVALSRSR